MARLEGYNGEVDVAGIIQEINDGVEELTSWEEDFLDSISSRSYLTEKQVDVLEKIAYKTGVEITTEDSKPERVQTTTKREASASEVESALKRTREKFR